jgi:hypothetical protein
MKELMSELFQIKKELALIKANSIKPLDDRKRELEIELLNYLENQGTDSARINGLGTISKTEAVMPQAEDWSKLYEHIQDTGSFHLLNRALNAAAYRETLESGVEVPGIVPFNKVTLSVRKDTAKAA